MIYLVSRRIKRELSKHATFSFGPGDEDRIDQIRLRLGQQGHLLNRSEVVRLAILALANESDLGIDSAVEQLKRLRPGRPPKRKS